MLVPVLMLKVIVVRLLTVNVVISNVALLYAPKIIALIN